MVNKPNERDPEALAAFLGSLPSKAKAVVRVARSRVDPEDHGTVTILDAVDKGADFLDAILRARDARKGGE